MEQVGQRLRFLREKAHLTQAKISVHISYIADYSALWYTFFAQYTALVPEQKGMTHVRYRSQNSGHNTRIDFGPASGCA